MHSRMPVCGGAAVRGARRAFALVELLVSIVIVAALIGVFMVSGSDSRRAASLGDSINNLKQFAWAGSAYSADNSDRFWAFSWRAGATSPSEFPDLEEAGTDLQAAANQAVDIIRRRANPAMPRINNWVPHTLYSQLVLADHLNLPLPTPWVASPMDVYKLAWQQYPSNPLALPQGGPEQLRWVYSSSYEVGPAFWSRDMKVGQDFVPENGTGHSLYMFQSPALPLGDRLVTPVVHPSRKAMVYDTHQRHFGSRQPFFGMAEARVLVMTADGSAQVRVSSEANVGFRPNVPAQSLSSQYTYSPMIWEPALPPGASSLATGRYRWTRGGLTGRDFGAQEACTGQPGCTP